MPIRVAFIEDNASLRKRFEQQFALMEDIRLVATYATAEGALRGIGKMPPEDRPEIALMDIELPGMSGVEATIAMRELFPATDVLMFTVFEDEEKIFRSIQAGAAGYMLKDAPITKVAEAIRELHGGGSPMSQSIARTVMSFVRSHSRPSEAPAAPPRASAAPVELELSARELEILQGLVEGKNYSSLADTLTISPHTVKTHIKNIYKKLHVHSRALAVRVALERGLV